MRAPDGGGLVVCAHSHRRTHKVVGTFSVLELIGSARAHFTPARLFSPCAFLAVCIFSYLFPLSPFAADHRYVQAVVVPTLFRLYATEPHMTHS